MIILEAGLPQYLNSIPAIQAMTHGRIYGAVREPASKLPALVFFRTNTTRQLQQCGTDALVSANLQVDCYGLNGQDAWALAATVRSALLGYSGMMGSVDGVWVDSVQLTNEFPLTDPEPGIIRVAQLYLFFYQED